MLMGPWFVRSVAEGTAGQLSRGMSTRATNTDPEIVGLAVRALAVVVLVAAFATPAGARSQRYEDAVLRDINEIRAHRGLAPLRTNAELTAAADYHSQEMIRRGFFAHDSADGAVFWRRLLARYSVRGY